MEERTVVDYPLYLEGCHKLGWTPLSFEEFQQLYALYLSLPPQETFVSPATRSVIAGLSYAVPEKRRGQFRASIIARLACLSPRKIARWMERHRVWTQLHFLETAVQHGINGGGTGTDSTGVGAPLSPTPPGRPGADAKEFPPQEYYQA